jgi:hypothetical protein
MMLRVDEPGHWLWLGQLWFDCIRCKRAVTYDEAPQACPGAPDGGPHEGIAPPSLRPRGWSLHVADCPKALPWLIGHELVDSACSCGKVR